MRGHGRDEVGNMISDNDERSINSSARGKRTYT